MNNYIHLCYFLTAVKTVIRQKCCVKEHSLNYFHGLNAGYGPGRDTSQGCNRGDLTTKPKSRPPFRHIKDTPQLPRMYPLPTNSRETEHYDTGNWITFYLPSLFQWRRQH